MDKQTQENLLNLVKRNYEEIALDFDTTRKKFLWPELIKLAEFVKNGDKILDVGCGNGRLVEAFKNKKINYLGVDNSETLIEAAKNNYQISNIKFLLGDILELDKLPENNFDYIFCIAVFHHLPSVDLRIKALEQMKNKINNNGKIIITVWNFWSKEKYRRIILKYGLLKIFGINKFDFGDILFDWKNNKGEKISQRYYHAFTKNQLKKLVSQAGFKIEKLYKDKYNYYLVLTLHLK
jgi:ubiquinone/menaquinone biosynthesis C-methylase UbiE